MRSGSEIPRNPPFAAASKGRQCGLFEAACASERKFDGATPCLKGRFEPLTPGRYRRSDRHIQDRTWAAGFDLRVPSRIYRSGRAPASASATRIRDRTCWYSRRRKQRRSTRRRRSWAQTRRQEPQVPTLPQPQRAQPPAARVLDAVSPVEQAERVGPMGEAHPHRTHRWPHTVPLPQAAAPSAVPSGTGSRCSCRRCSAPCSYQQTP